MTSESHLVSRTILAFVLLALAAAALAAQPGTLKADCSKGPAAGNFNEGAWCLETQRWNDAIPWLLDEIESGPSADADDVRSLFGMIAKYRYLPYFYLGFCYSESGDCVAALDCFEEARRQGEAETVKKPARVLNERRKRCLGAVADAPPDASDPVCSRHRRK